MKTDKKIITYDDLPLIRSKYTKKRKKIVLTTGCYDLLHFGHVIHLNSCKELGDILVVSVGNDKTVRELKGPDRPVIDENFRARMLAALEVVDYVIISTESGMMDHTLLFSFLKPDIYAVSEGNSFEKEKKELARKFGAAYIVCHRKSEPDLKDGISTTKLIEDIGRGKGK